MIIWGSKGKTKVIGRGQFFCPRCQRLRPYEHKQVGKYFTLYFIPLFQTSNLGEYIECKVCFTPFEKSVLDYDPGLQKEMQDFLVKIQEQLDSGLPVHIIYEGLIKEGASEDVANNVIAIATKGKFKVCNECKLIYSAALSFCSNCGKKLTIPE
jgi:hypothetical protein